MEAHQYTPIALVRAIIRRLDSKFPESCNDRLAGLGLRVGCPIYGASDNLEYCLRQCTITLLVEQGGAGKSTVLRAMYRLLSDTSGQCVVVVHTTNELGGFGYMPHQSLGTRDVTRLLVHKRPEH